MPLTISKLLQDQLNEITDFRFKMELLVQLRGNNNPTPEEIQRAIADMQAGKLRPLRGEEREAAENEAEQQILLTSLKRLQDLPDEEKTMEVFGQMRCILRDLKMIFPEEPARRK